MNCNIIKDLLPMYIEKLTSESSNNLIENHIKTCEECKQTLLAIKEEIVVDKEVKVENVEKVATGLVRKIQKSIYEKILMAVSLTFILGLLIGIFSAKIFMFIAFIGSISIIAFTTAIFISIPICRKRYSLKKQFKVLGYWVFLFSMIISFVAFALFWWFFDNSTNIFIILILEILYNILLILALRIYARLKLPKEDIIDKENPWNKKLFIVTFITLIFIIAVIAVPVTLIEANRIIDNVNLPFVNDSDVIGKWIAVDFVRSPEMFNPDKQTWTEELFLKKIIFFENGQLRESFVKDESANLNSPTSWLAWTKGFVLNKGNDQTASKYFIKDINGTKYMFFEWKSGDYSYLHRQPSYYVFKQEL